MESDPYLCLADNINAAFNNIFCVTRRTSVLTDSSLSVCLYHPIHGQTLNDELLMYLRNTSCRIVLNYSYDKSALWSYEASRIIDRKVDLASPNYINDIADTVYRLTTPVFYRYVEYTLLRTHGFKLTRLYGEHDEVNELRYVTGQTTLHIRFKDNDFKIYDTTHALRRHILTIHKKWLAHVEITRNLRDSDNTIDNIVNQLKYAVGEKCN